MSDKPANDLYFLLNSKPVIKKNREFLKMMITYITFAHLKKINQTIERKEGGGEEREQLISAAVVNYY